jgi:hypothetical protein
LSPDIQGYRHLIKNSPTNCHKAPTPWRDMTSFWLSGWLLNSSTGVIALRADPTPELDRVPNYPLGEDHPGAIYLQPKEKR